MTLLSAINDAQRALSLAVTSAIAADGQETQNLLFLLAKDEAADLLDRDDYDFTTLTRTQSFTATTGATLQAAPGKPSNFHRAIEGTFWNQSKDRPISGPLTSKEWALANGEPVMSTITQWVMYRHDGLHIYPAPTVADTIAYEYVINTPVLANDGTTYKTTFTADNDTYLLGDRILRLGVVWRYKAAKGRDYAEDLRNYELALAAKARAEKGTARVLSIAPDDNDVLPEGNVPDSGFGA